MWEAVTAIINHFLISDPGETATSLSRLGLRWDGRKISILVEINLWETLLLEISLRAQSNRFRMRTSHPLAITQETDLSMTTLLSLAAALFCQTRHSHSVKTRSDEAASGKYFKTRYFNRKGHKFNEEATFLWRAGFLLLQMLLLGPYSWDLCKVASFLCVASFSFKVLKTFSILFLRQFSEFPQPVRLCDARRFAQPRQVQQDNPGLQAEAEGECGLHLW